MAVDAMRLMSLFVQQMEAGRQSDWKPPTDIYALPDGWLVKMELAGVEPDDVGLTLRGRSLLVRGRRRDNCDEPISQQLHMEINYSRFERVIELPADVQRVSIETKFRHGMLMIRLRREDRS